MSQRGFFCRNVYARLLQEQIKSMGKRGDHVVLGLSETETAAVSRLLALAPYHGGVLWRMMRGNEKRAISRVKAKIRKKGLRAKT
jgi:hypothetical protein